MRIIKEGILDSIQDVGRFGYQYLGINPTGAMDKYAMKITNILVGNLPTEAVIEMHFPAGVFMFTQPALIAIGGANFSPSINGDFIPHLHPVMVNKNDVLQFHKPVNGSRAYIAVAGGFFLADWMNSKSTNLKAKSGGFSGRKLLKNDILKLYPLKKYPDHHHSFTVLPWKADTNWNHQIEKTEIPVLDIIPGNEWERLTEESKKNITTSSIEISQQSDRMGYRLNNIPLATSTGEEIISTGVSFGTIQLLPDGKMIILMADHQTTGGYPRIAHIISAHHSALAQAKAGDKIRFRISDIETAEELYIKQQQHLLQLQNACTFRLQEYYKRFAK